MSNIYIIKLRTVIYTFIFIQNFIINKILKLFIKSSKKSRCKGCKWFAMIILHLCNDSNSTRNWEQKISCSFGLNGEGVCGLSLSLSLSLEFGVWNLGFGVWSLGFGVWSLEFGVWSLGFGVWSLEFGVWNLEFVICDLEFVICDL